MRKREQHRRNSPQRSRKPVPQPGDREYITDSSIPELYDRTAVRRYILKHRQGGSAQRCWEYFLEQWTKGPTGPPTELLKRPPTPPQPSPDYAKLFRHVTQEGEVTYMGETPIKPKKLPDGWRPSCEHRDGYDARVRREARERKDHPKPSENSKVAGYTAGFVDGSRWKLDLIPWCSFTVS